MKNRTKAKLAAGETVFGAMVNLPSPAVVELLAYAHLDFAVLNTEHAAIDVAAVAEMVRAAEAAGIDLLLRVGSSDGVGIARCLDLGVAGVQAPAAGTRQGLQRLVRAIKYPPQGGRRLSPARTSAFEEDVAKLEEYASSANRETMIVCKIGSREAALRIDELLAVDGVDVFFVGPADLAQSMGRPGETHHPDVMAVQRRVIERVAAAGKVAGATASDLERDCAAGARYFIAPDFRLLLGAAREFVRHGNRIAAERG